MLQVLLDLSLASDIMFRPEMITLKLNLHDVLLINKIIFKKICSKSLTSHRCFKTFNLGECIDAQKGTHHAERAQELLE